MCGFLGGGSNVGGDARAQQQAQQQQIGQATGQINNAFSQYTPQWYQNYTNQYQNSAMPNLYQQYNQTQNDLSAQLANQGLSKSTAAGQLGGRLNTQFGEQKQGIANDALNATNSLRQNVANSQQNLIGQANTAADPFSAANAAYGTAASFNSPSLAAPVAGLFQNFANTYLGSRLQSAYGGGTPYYGGSLNFGSTLPATNLG
jgi:hypothetical protein